MKFCLLLFCLILCFVESIGQNDFPIKTFLASAGQEESVLFQNQKLNFLTTTSYKLPLIERLQFRTNTNDFDIRLQEYSLRMSPNSFRSVKSQQQYQNSNQNLTKMELEVAWGEALRERYDLLVNLIYSKEILAVRNKQKVLYKDKVTLLKRSISLPGFDVLELIDAEDEAEENQRDILDLENAILTYENNVHGTNSTSGFIRIDKDNTLTVNSIGKVLDGMKSMKTTNHPQLKVLSAKVQNNRSAYRLEAAQSKFSVAYIEAKYDFGPKFSLQKSFSIGLGFELPVKGSTKLNLNDLQIDIFEAESEYKAAENYLEREKSSNYQQLDNLIKKYELVSQQLNNSQAEFALNEYRKIAEASPQALLKLRENTLKKELLLQQLEFEIIKTFIEYLDFSGLLSQRPLKNYLSIDLDGF